MLEQLERSVSFKQLQINRLLDVTQAINGNVSAAGLYKIYKDLLIFEMSIKKVMLVTHLDGERWETATFYGVDEPTAAELESASTYLLAQERTHNITGESNPLLKQFDIVIPVFHKKSPIAFALIGGLDDNDDVYEKVRFITTVTNIVTVAIENKRLFKRQLEQERLKHELTLAVQMQNTLIPDQLPSNQDFELSGIYMPHHGVGGDYYDYIPMGDDGFVFCIADISGKGIAAALLMSNFQANLQALIRRKSDPVQFIQLLNKAVLKATRGDKFITFFVGRYNYATRKLRYINCGHNPPQLRLPDGQMKSLDKGCTILGIFPSLPNVEVGEVEIPRNSLLVAYTDGLSDLTNPEGDYFGDENIKLFLANSPHKGAAAFNKALLEHINEFKQEEEFPDDISVLSCSFF